MAMKESEKSNPCKDRLSEDRLSELPDSIIFDIFGSLPMCDVVRTTVLSKRWNNLWTTTPYLNFDSCIDHEGIDQYRQHLKFVNRALSLWKGFKIFKFKIVQDTRFEKNDVGIDDKLWLGLVMDHGVEELYFENSYMKDLYWVSHNLCSCSSLKVLSLKYCLLPIPWYVKWNQLRSLTIDGAVFRTEQTVNKLLSGSPQLEVFILKLRKSNENLRCDKKSNENLCIRSSSLKKLLIFNARSYPSTELRICTPNLKTLDFVGAPYGQYLLEDVSSVTHLALDFSFSETIADDLLEDVSSETIADDFLGRVLEQIFPNIHHVENFTLSDWSIKVLGGAIMKDKYLLAPFSNFNLTIIRKGDVAEYEDILNLHKISPQMERLVVQSDYSQDPANHPDIIVHAERNLPDSFLLQLQTVEITYIENDRLLLIPFIEILLKHARNLRKMVVRAKGIRMPLCSEFEQTVVRMPRCAPMAELIFADY